MQTKLIFFRITFVFCLSLFIFSCENNVEEELVPIEGIDANKPDPCADITFSAKVKPIIDNNCLQCHGNGGFFPNLTSFSSINTNAGRVKDAVVSRRMPQGGSLSQADIDAIACWVDAGANND